MSRPSHLRRSPALVVAACFLSAILTACAADGPVEPRSRPAPVFNGTDTTSSPCDSARSGTRCHATQNWG